MLLDFTLLCYFVWSSLSLSLAALVLADTVPCVGAWNKIGTLLIVTKATDVDSCVECCPDITALVDWA